MLLVATLFLLAACKPPVGSEPQSEKSFTYLVIDTYQIPELTTPEEQLTYARSSFEDPEEKNAALKAVTVLHPKDRLHGGLAALELAFFNLGEDFRLANSHHCSLAAKNYLEIIHEYADLPEICAKAYWYLGWISCDLLGKRELGIAYYLKIIQQYPHEPLSPLPPAPWLSINHEDIVQKHQSFYLFSWADLARLEIIRHTTDKELAWHSFRAIRQQKAIGGIDGAALRILVANHGLDPKSNQLIREYLRSDSVGSILKNDLLLLLSSSYRR